jgi:enoyl-[acyl-carrier-protein] reductase (NADH)
MAGPEGIVGSLRDAALLNQLATFDDVGKAAAFVASDQARTMSSATGQCLVRGPR